MRIRFIDFYCVQCCRIVIYSHTGCYIIITITFFYVEHQRVIYTQKLVNVFIHVQNLMLLIINCMHTDTGRLMYCGWCYRIWKSSKELGSEDNFDVIKTENLFSLTVAYPDFLLLNLFIFYILDSTEIDLVF